MSQNISGVLVNYVIGPRSQTSKQCLIKFAHVTSPGEASRLVGRKIVWKGSTEASIGVVIAIHGRNGLVKARFRKGVPGQALGTAVELMG